MSNLILEQNLQNEYHTTHGMSSWDPHNHNVPTLGKSKKAKGEKESETRGHQKDKEGDKTIWKVAEYNVALYNLM